MGLVLRLVFEDVEEGVGAGGQKIKH
ncbi:MAG: hypothetical protein ACD_61C00154G0001, partial [uncultured bacterium]